METRIHVMVPLLLLFSLWVYCLCGEHISPTCGSANKYTIVTITGSHSNDSDVYINGNWLPTSYIMSKNSSEIVFLTPRNLIPGVNWIKTCSSNKTACTNQTKFYVIEVPPVLSSLTVDQVGPDEVNVTIEGFNFLECGSALIRVGSSIPVDIAVQVVSANLMKMSMDRKRFLSLSGAVTFSLNGQQFDSLSVKPLIFNVQKVKNPAVWNGESSNLLWLWVVLGVIGFCAAIFLVFMVYKYKQSHNYGKFQHM